MLKSWTDPETVGLTQARRRWPGLAVPVCSVQVSAASLRVTGSTSLSLSGWARRGCWRPSPWRDLGPQGRAQAQADQLTVTDGATGSDSELVTDRLARVRTRRDHHDAAAAATVVYASRHTPLCGNTGELVSASKGRIGWPDYLNLLRHRRPGINSEMPTPT